MNRHERRRRAKLTGSSYAHTMAEQFRSVWHNKVRVAKARENEKHYLSDTPCLYFLPPARTEAIGLMEKEQPSIAGKEIQLNAFNATVGPRSFRVGFGLWDDQGPSLICRAVIERLIMDTPKESVADDAIMFRSIGYSDEDAFERVLETLRSFTGDLLIITFPDSLVYDEAMVRLIKFYRAKA